MNASKMMVMAFVSLVATAGFGVRSVDIRDFGAQTAALPKANAVAIQKAIDAVNASGGGRVCVPAGEWLSGTLWLKSGVELHLEKEAILKASPNFEDYNADDAYPENWGCPPERWRGLHFVICRDCDNVSITGPGTLHGNGDVFFAELPPDAATRHAKDRYWWDGFRLAKDRVRLRPGQLVAFIKSRHLRVDGLTIRNSPCWSLYFYGCRDVTVRHYIVRNGLTDGNTDGVDVDCCQNVLLEDLDVITGDDGVAIRGAGKRLGLDPQPPCENVVVRRARLNSSACAFRIGVGDGTIRNVRIEDVTSTRCGSAVLIQSCYGKPEFGGVDIENIVVRNCRFENCRHAYGIQSGGKKTTFGIRNVVFEGVQFDQDAPRGVSACDGCPQPFNIVVK